MWMVLCSFSWIVKKEMGSDIVDSNTVSINFPMTSADIEKSSAAHPEVWFED